MLNVDYVQELMDDHGWTLGQLSSKSGLSKAQLSRLFRDKRHAGAKTMEGILRTFPEADKDRLFFYKERYQSATDSG
jgi:helix-turn-helix domain-containing protein